MVGIQKVTEMYRPHADVEETVYILSFNQGIDDCLVIARLC